MKEVPTEKLIALLKRLTKKKVKHGDHAWLQLQAEKHLNRQLQENAPSQPTFYNMPSPSGSTLNATTHFPIEEYILSTASLHYANSLRTGVKRKDIVTELAEGYAVRIKDMKHIMDKEDLCRSRVADIADHLYGRFLEPRHIRRLY